MSAARDFDVGIRSGKGNVHDESEEGEQQVCVGDRRNRFFYVRVCVCACVRAGCLLSLWMVARDLVSTSLVFRLVCSSRDDKEAG